jgi:lysophospholipase L1-like esterase
MKHIKKYVPIHLAEEMPDTVVIVGGGNDLSPRKSTLEVANEIIDCGIISKMHGARKVIISSVMPRSNFYYQLDRHQLNVLLKKLCDANNFYFLENSDISLSKHIANDGVHLNFDGTKVLANNILDCLN